MIKIYLIPVEKVLVNGETRRGPEYFRWRYDANPPSIQCAWSLMDYGFIDNALIVAKDITQADHDSLVLHNDVYAFPDNLNQPIQDKPAIDVFFENLKIPTNWTTPSTTYLQLIRMTAGLFQFNQRYGGLSNGASVFDNGITLDSNYNQLDAQHTAWFEATLVSFGWTNGVQGNPKLRSLAKQASDLWGNNPFYLGGVTF
jgi:hypothetical protein